MPTSHQTVDHARLFTQEVQERIDILEAIGNPVNAAILAQLYRGEDALTLREIQGMFPTLVRTAIVRHLQRLRKLKILGSTIRGLPGVRGGKFGEYYVHPQASDFTQEVLRLTFEQGEA